jgi:hypothetical protein
MCKELPVILVNKVVDPKRIIGKKWRAEEEERHKGSLTPPKKSCGFESIPGPFPLPRHGLQERVSKLKSVLRSSKKVFMDRASRGINTYR